MSKPYENFDHQHYAWRKNIDYRKQPERYKVGKGEQGVLLCEPYKSEILPNWRFKTPAIAKQSAEKIYQQFLDYLKQDDFIGSDMARKFLQMGFTRARRYTNYKGGRKYQKGSEQKMPIGTGEPDKAISAKIFYEYWRRAEAEPQYKKQKAAWRKKYG